MNSMYNGPANVGLLYIEFNIAYSCEIELPPDTDELTRGVPL